MRSDVIEDPLKDVDIDNLFFKDDGGESRKVPEESRKLMQVVIFKEKYDNQVFVFETYEDWSRICMQVFTKRDSESYYYDIKEPGTSPKKPESPSEEAPDYIKEAFDKEMYRYSSEHRRWRMQKEDFILAEKARQGNLDAARNFIEGRKDREYEGYEVLETKSFNKTPQWEISDVKQSSLIVDLLIEIKDNPENVNFEDLRESLEEIVKTGKTKKVSGPNFPYSALPNERTCFHIRMNSILKKGEIIEKDLESIDRLLSKFNYT